MSINIKDLDLTKLAQEIPSFPEKQQKEILLALRRLNKGRTSTGKVKKAPETDDELWELIRDDVGDEIPRVAVCEDHNAPFDFVADYFFERERALLVMANREGGKTRQTAIVNYLNCEYKPECSICTFADIEAQSNKSYNYIKSFVEPRDDTGQKKLKSSIDGEPLRKETKWKNGSKLEVIIGCLPGHARVITPDGPQHIQHLVAKKKIGPVKSYNFEKNQWEWKPITNWFKNGVTRNWSSIKLEIGSHGQSDLTATPNHEVLDTFGRKKSIINLESGDSIAVWGQDISNEQEQVLIGSLLGDGGISKGNESSKGPNKNGGHRYRVTHSMQQYYYLDWMADVFSEFKPTFFRREAKNTKDVDFECTRFFTEARKIWYPEGKKRIPDSVWEKLDILGLAVWLMDDGNVAKRKVGRPGRNEQKNGIVWVLCALIFNKHEREKCQEYFNNLGVDGSWNCIDKESDAWIWQATQDGSLLLQSLVSDYIDISVKQERGWKRWIGPPIKEHSKESVCKAKIRTITHNVELDYPRNSRKFDIEVEGNHNYLLTTGVLVGNSKSGVNSPHTNKVHADEIDLMDIEIWNESRSIASSGKGKNGKLIKAQDIATSTRKSAKGLMQTLINESEKAEKEDLVPPWRVYKHCIIECAEEVSECRCVPKLDRENRLKELDRFPNELCNCNKIVKGEWTEGNPRTLETVCKGKLFRARGWMKYEDIVGKFMQNSPNVWVAQHECRRPMADGLYLPTWNRDRHTIKNWEPRPEYGLIWQGIDWGGASSSASFVTWVQGPLHQPIEVQNNIGSVTVLPQGSYVAFKELVETTMGASRLADKVVRQEIQYKNQFPGWRVKARFPDPAGKMQRNDWHEHNPPLKTVFYAGREVSPQIENIQSLVADNLLYVDSVGCPNLCDDFESWRQKDGTEIHDDATHGPASMRYLLINVKIVVKRYNKNTTYRAEPVVSIEDRSANYPGALAGNAVGSSDIYDSEAWRRSKMGPGVSEKEPWNI